MGELKGQFFWGGKSLGAATLAPTTQKILEVALMSLSSPAGQGEITSCAVTAAQLKNISSSLPSRHLLAFHLPPCFSPNQGHYG